MNQDVKVGKNIRALPYIDFKTVAKKKKRSSSTYISTTKLFKVLPVSRKRANTIVAVMIIAIMIMEREA